MKRGLAIACVAVAATLLWAGLLAACGDEPAPEGDVAPRAGPGAPDGAAGLLQLVAEETGLSVDEIQSECQPGRSLAAIIEAEGGDVDGVLAAAVAQSEARLQAQVEAGRLTEEQAASSKAGLAAELESMLHSTEGTCLDRIGAGRGFSVPSGVDRGTGSRARGGG